ncbi:MAG: hypothetical protein KIT34_03430 [Cyanobacteria bacterium TGS_CYA1]|nr:hypothetical protein [Cyanobacteria bacterium TGS_CYA1]MDX2107181.1 hypothetical protein [Candidatus Melainabacteria bacterium]
MRFSAESKLILFLLLGAGTLGLLSLVVVLPTLAIQSLWNFLASFNFASFVPAINFWQAILLYLACLLMIYISGLVKIEFKIKRFD